MLTRMSVDAPSLERLSATAVRKTVGQLSTRISTRFPRVDLPWSRTS